MTTRLTEEELARIRREFEMALSLTRDPEERLSVSLSEGFALLTAASDLARLEAENEKLRAERERMAKVVEAAALVMRVDDDSWPFRILHAALEDLAKNQPIPPAGERIEPKEEGGNG